jgi:NADH-quinone oxidoreductase subunit E
MAVRRLAETQPESFAFTAENRAWADGQIAKYPPGRQASAVIPLLWKAQEQAGGWLPRAAIEHVGQVLGMPTIRVLEIATFYTMFNLAPVGEHFVQVCGTTPCMLRGAEDIKRVCRERIGEQRHVTADGKFSWLEVECLGACVNAPMAQINADYYEDLTVESFNRLLDDLAAGRPVKTGPQIDRQLSAPVGGPTTLTDPALVVGAAANDAAPVSDEHKPALLAAARGGAPDDLKLIWGVGPKLEEMLHRMGVFHFDQIAAWSEMNLRWVDQNLEGFKGRAVRDKWIDQAKKLATGWRPSSDVGEKPQG